MTSIQDQIVAAASRNTELLKTLSDTDYAPPALEQKAKYIKELQHEIDTTQTEINRLTGRREQEFKDHKKYRDSVLKKFAYKAGGKSEKFEARAHKEEREYFDALQDEHNAKERKKYLEHQLSEAQSSKANLEQVIKQNKDAQAALDSLYESIFGGPTPSMPQEDQAEFKASDALHAYRETRQKWDAEDQALRLLLDANTAMRQALQSMESALDYSRWDMWGGGAMSDMMERNELSKAQSLCSTVYMLIGQALRLSPEIKAMPRMEIEQGHILGDVIFDNIFSDMAMHDRIKNSRDSLTVGAQHLLTEINSCQARASSLRHALTDQEKELLNSRRELQLVRQRAFEEVAGSRTQGDDEWWR